MTPTDPWLELIADAFDPDSPCDHDPARVVDRCHDVLDGQAARFIPPGIVAYEWSVLESPMRVTGRLQDVLPNAVPPTLVLASA